jgi:hypothetical protein
VEVWPESTQRILLVCLDCFNPYGHDCHGRGLAYEAKIDASAADAGDLFKYLHCPRCEQYDCGHDCSPRSAICGDTVTVGAMVYFCERTPGHLGRHEHSRAGRWPNEADEPCTVTSPWPFVRCGKPEGHGSHHAGPDMMGKLRTWL